MIATGPDGSSFYFYSPQVVAQGKTKFQRQWGRRTLEDDWRRRKKEMSTFMEQADNTVDETENSSENGLTAEGEAAGELPDELTDNPKTREFYLQQIPFTPEDIEASDLIIMDGLYHMAMIYKDKLEGFPVSLWKHSKTLGTPLPGS